MIDYQNCESNYAEILGLQTIYALGVLKNASCANDTLLFFCNATLLLCSGNSSSVNLTEECKEVRDNKCISEWRIVEHFYNRSVPDCTSYAKDANLTFEVAPKLPCPKNSGHFCGTTCLPVCGEYSLFLENTVLVAITITFEILGLIGGVITLIICYFKHHKV